MQTVNGDWFCLPDDYWTDWYDVSRPTNSNGNDDTELRSDLINNVSGNFASTVCHTCDTFEKPNREIYFLK